jgi:serine/threonine protein kinase
MQEVVGIGGFGRVYKAINKKENDRVCALKVLKKESVA